MKKVIFILVMVLLNLLACENESKQVQEKPEPTRILNDEFKGYLTQIIQLQKLTFDKESDVFYAFVAPTENWIYVQVSTTHCDSYKSEYSFQEEIGDNKIYFFIPEKSTYQKLFNLRGLEPFKNDFEDLTICHNWYWVATKLSWLNQRLTMNKMATFYENQTDFNFLTPAEIADLQKIDEDIYIEEIEDEEKTTL